MPRRITDRQFELANQRIAARGRGYSPFYFTRNSGRMGQYFDTHARFSRSGSYFEMRTNPREWYKYLNVTALSNGGSRVQLRGSLRGVVRGKFWEDITAYLAQIDPETATTKDIARLNRQVDKVVRKRVELGKQSIMRAKDRANEQMHAELSRVNEREQRLMQLIDEQNRIEGNIKQAKKDSKNAVNAKRRHQREIQRQIDKLKQMDSAIADKSQQAARIARKSAGKDHLEPNKVVNTRSNKPIKLYEGTRAGKTLTKLANNRWLRRGVISFAAMFAMSKVMSTITGSDRRAIPEHYERGYDLINETLTDFGSPVKLWKVASKTIMPYKSSMRRGLRTSTSRIIESNPALDMAANAIKHHQF